MDLVLTYDELAERLSISRNAARVMAQRHKWRRTIGNDGRARVHVPAEALEARQAGQEPRPQNDLEKAYLARIAALEAQHEARTADKDAEIARLAAETQVARLEADAARQDVREMTDRLDRLHRERQADAERLGRLEAENGALRAELAAARRRWWHRLIRR